MEQGKLERKTQNDDFLHETRVCTGVERALVLCNRGSKKGRVHYNSMSPDQGEHWCRYIQIMTKKIRSSSEKSLPRVNQGPSEVMRVGSRDETSANVKKTTEGTKWSPVDSPIFYAGFTILDKSISPRPSGLV